ncbi:MAG: hypothetical protein RL291_1609 [Pseudomonadota bacterium]
MLALVRLVMIGFERLVTLPVHALRFLAFSVVMNPRLGPLRYVATAAVAYLVFALVLVYIVAPIRGIVGAQYLAQKIHYDAERWLATAVYDRHGAFIGTFDPRLDSKKDVNFTDSPIEHLGHIANPDHKSIPVRDVPDMYWQCLVYHEDRYLGSYLNPYGVDLMGVLKIPYSSIRRTIATKRPTLGVGGSTLPMQFARVIRNTPPSAAEGSITKLKRKMSEWWMAPVIYHTLTRGGSDLALRQWAANHIWLAQRTGGQPLHGVEVTARTLFGKQASELSVAEQFVLASAVNKPVILLPGNDKLNAVRLDRWRYITEVRARVCAERLITDKALQKQVLFELVDMASGPPEPKVKPVLQTALDQYAPNLAQRAQANPVIRANALLPAARFGLREEMKETYGHNWRNALMGVTTTLDAASNLAFHERVKGELAKLDQAVASRLLPNYTLDPAKAQGERKTPSIVVVAANARGEIVRYFELGEQASYFGSPLARDSNTGFYDPTKEPRRVASTGKILTAIAVANEGRDTTSTLYTDTLAPERGLETCERGTGTYGRKALVSFACSLNRPLEWRAAQLGQARARRLIDTFGFAMPPGQGTDGETPPSTATVRGLISGSPRRVHHMSSVVLAALTGQGHKPVTPPSLVKGYDFTTRMAADLFRAQQSRVIVPNAVVRPASAPMLKALLSSPLCYRAGGQATGTLKALARWCADGRRDLKLHFAKTGTDTTADPSMTVENWITGGIQFANGAAYSYVVLLGTGSTREPFGRNLHASQSAVPLVDMLLAELEQHAKDTMGRIAAPKPKAEPASPVAARPQAPSPASPTATAPTRARTVQAPAQFPPQQQ